VAGDPTRVIHWTGCVSNGKATDQKARFSQEAVRVGRSGWLWLRKCVPDFGTVTRVRKRANLGNAENSLRKC
jgi:hypothetical protein